MFMEYAQTGSTISMLLVEAGRGFRECLVWVVNECVCHYRLTIVVKTFDDGSGERSQERLRKPGRSSLVDPISPDVQEQLIVLGCKVEFRVKQIRDVAKLLELAVLYIVHPRLNLLSRLVAGRVCISLGRSD